MYYLIVCYAINIVLDIVLVVFLNMGVAGVAIATVSAQAISAILTLRALFKMKKTYQFEGNKFHLDHKILRALLWIGFPTAFQSGMNSISGMVMTFAINGAGTITMAGNKERMKNGVKVCLELDLLFSAILSVFFFFSGNTLFYLFTDDTAVITSGMEVLKAIVPYYVLVAFYEITGSALTEESIMVPMIINIAGLCGIRIFWICIIIPLFPQWNNLYGNIYLVKFQGYLQQL